MALTDGLIAWYELGEASGTRNDSHGTNHLTDNNSVGQAAGKVGNCATFDRASSQSLDVASNANLEFTGNDFSIAGWVYFVDESVAAAIFSKWSYVESSSEWILYYRAAGAYFSFYVSDGTTAVPAHATTFGAASNGVWYFVACYHDSVADKIAISVNDGTVDEAAFTWSSGTPTVPMKLGLDQTATNYLDGRLDSWGYWNRKLSAAEITQLYNSGNGLAYADLTASPHPLAGRRSRHAPLEPTPEYSW